MIEMFPAVVTPLWLSSWMMAWLALPTTLQTFLLALTGIIGGALANHIIPTWAYCPRPISPWVKRDRWPLLPEYDTISQRLPNRTWMDRIPILGWFRLSREAELFGRGFWIRPMLIELTLGFVFPLMHSLYLAGQPLPASVLPNVIAQCGDWMALLFFLHAAMLVWLVAATFIDFDERTIPDLLTVPGTIAAITIGSITPFAFMPGEVVSNGVSGIAPVLAGQPFAFNSFWLSGRALAVGLAIWAVWCFALADRRFYWRGDWSKAWGRFWLGLTRHDTWKFLVTMWLVGSLGIFAVYRFDATAWLGMLTSLMGLAVGGGIVWIVRLVGGWAMQREAMGFGDVTLMAMIGALIGWQGSVLTFFLSPIAAIAIVLVVAVLTRDWSLPFGPYLCLGTVLVVLFWDEVYNQRFRTALLLTGDVMLILAIVMPVMLAAMMWCSRKFREFLSGA